MVGAQLQTEFLLVSPVVAKIASDPPGQLARGAVGLLVSVGLAKM